VHVGASPIGYAALSATGIPSVNESRGDPGVWRSTHSFAPHNAFTSTIEARVAALERSELWPGSWGPLVFKSPFEPTVAPWAAQISLSYPGGYSVHYELDPESNRYLRTMDGQPHLDGATGEQLAAANVVVQVIPDEVIDSEGRLDLAQTGVGAAYYFVDGTVSVGSWTKADFGSRTFFWDTAGNEVRFNTHAPTWIQVVPSDSVLRYG
jgi:hypothetical protein